MYKSKYDMFNKRLLSVIAKICVSIIILWILFTRIEISNVIETLLKTKITFIAIAILISLAGLLLGVYRWQISLAAQKLRIPFIMILNASLISRFLGFLLPAFIGGDAIRGYEIFKYRKHGLNVFASILFERICGLISMVGIGSCALYFNVKKEGDLSLITPFIIVYFILILMIIGCFSKVITKRVLFLLELVPRFNWVREKLKNFSEAIYIYRRYPKVWCSVMSLSALFVFAGILFYYTIALSLSLDIPLITFCILMPIINIVTMTPISPGGLGVKEGMFVILFNQYGVPPVEALLISLIGTALYIVYILLGAILYIAKPKAESAS